MAKFLSFLLKIPCAFEPEIAEKALSSGLIQKPKMRLCRTGDMS